ncbi:hypothetical protein FYK55_14305 [Roseiconus nitratireducens]|uniref:4-O-methyl-glucuronoyl methylesterase-like domain-containing protein n=1 Tax=Roseiconus nitratireducens TaxID=2605748 RepID=A0A5M6D9S2_9BACT|nr:hypothetical protein [Roseiconus nitratireducens]KAA5542699.1 hypothetical protein FYK55_14305 [Roseiconus nitratireducens]
MTRSLISLFAITSVSVFLCAAFFPKCGLAAEPFPTVNQLPVNHQLPDPFQFFGSDRRVKTLEDWEQRQAEMMEMLQHYIYGPAFPQVNQYKVESRAEEPLAGGEVIKYSADLKLGPDLSAPVSISYYLLPNKEANSILVYVVAREEPADEDAIAIARRGYAYTALKVGPYEKIARRLYPEIDGTRTMGWVWGMNEIIHYLTHEHQIDKVILTGCSRYGRVALLTGALNDRVDLTAPITTLAHAVHHIDQSMWGPGNVKWANKEYETFANQMDRMPVDRHFLGAVIAPRAYLGIMGAEKPAFNQGHIKAYESLAPVYQWLGAPNNLGLYDHKPRGHGVTIDDLHTVLDFADQSLFGKNPASGKQFNPTDASVAH